MRAMAQTRRYRSLSSVGEVLLPRAERMHRGGMTWRQVARELKISYTALYMWRKLGAGPPEKGDWEDG